MFKLIEKAIGNRLDKAPMTSHDRAERTRIAASVILLEAVYADNDCTESEIAHAVETLKAQFGISQQCAEELLELGRRERSQALDLWQFTNQINGQFSKEDKISIMEAVWRIIHADGKLEKHEDHFAHKLAMLLRLTPSELIDAKLKAKQQIQ